MTPDLVSCTYVFNLKLITHKIATHQSIGHLKHVIVYTNVTTRSYDNDASAICVIEVWL